MRVCFTNLGCKLNQAELEKMARQFHAAGHQVVATLDRADLHVINTCTVTHMAARGSRKLARRGSRHHPGLRTVLTGCYVSEQPEQAAELAGVDLVVPNDVKDELLARVHAAFPDEVPEQLHGHLQGRPGDLPYLPEVAGTWGPLEFGNTRGLVKVEDGCNMRCSFCIIPFTRGRQHSRPLTDCVAEVQALAEGGYQEVVVTGVQISSYRTPEGERLYDLVHALLADTDIPRLRLTSIAPWQLDRRLLRLWSEAGSARGGRQGTSHHGASHQGTSHRGTRLCRHVHFSLQSGSTETLHRMRRPYTAEQYADLLAEVRDAVPGMAVTTDVIVGFPGETDAEFDDNLAFTQRMVFAKVHAFPYSSRPGTLAANLPDHVEHSVKRERMARMLAVTEAAEEDFRRAQLGQTAEVLWEGAREGVWQGMTDNYLRVFTESSEDLGNRLLPVQLEEMVDGGVKGRVLSGRRAA